MFEGKPKDVSNVVGGCKRYYTFFMVVNQLFFINFKPKLLKTNSVDFTQYEHNFKQPFIVF